MSEFIKVFVDDKPVRVLEGFTVMQSCAIVGTELPRFCYHEKLQIAGNCRICLVEVSNNKKLVASCAAQVSSSIKIYSNTIRVRLARQNVLEFLLANHPLDCPICDQGGECDLQDITMAFGADRGRFYETNKRAVLNKNIGPLVKTSMNRCIHCTRCVRFITLVSGVAVLGMVNRGSSSEISGYVNVVVDDPLSGNVIDLCPVGALTSKPFAFKARVWELTSVKTIDVFDTMHSSILVDVAANQICRILPYANARLNEDWITNKIRFFYDGVFSQRLYYCLVSLSSISIRLTNDVLGEIRGLDVFCRISWHTAASYFYVKLFNNNLMNFSFVVGSLVDITTVLGLNKYTSILGGALINYSCWPLYKAYNHYFKDWEFLFFFNVSLSSITDMPSFCLFLSVNIKFELPIVSLKLSRIQDESYLAFYSIGFGSNYLNSSVKNISNSLSCMLSIASFKNKFCVNIYNRDFALWPFIFVNEQTVNSAGVYGAVILFLKNIKYATNISGILLYLKNKIALTDRDQFSNLNIFSSIFTVYTHPKMISFNSTCILSKLNKFVEDTVFFNKIFEMRYMVGFDGIDVEPSSLQDWSIYQGSYGTGLAFATSLILPVNTFNERVMYYKNFLGELSNTEVVLTYNEAFLRGDLKDDLWVFNFLSSFLAKFYWIQNFDVKSPLLSYTYNVMMDVKKISFLFYAPFKDSLKLSVFLLDNLDYYKTFNNFFFLSTKSIFYFNLWDDNLFNFLVPFTVNNFFCNTYFLSANSSLMNYYSDPSVINFSLSKPLTSSANFFFKKNFSFSNKFNNYV